MSYDRREDGLRSDGTNGHVLITDDAPFITKQLEKMLAADGYKVVATAHDGEAAVNLYKEHYPDIDLVTLDVTMPKMDGITTLEQILTFDGEAHVVMITSFGSESLVRRAIALGAKNFVTKPIQPEKVLPRLRDATRK